MAAIDTDNIFEDTIQNVVEVIDNNRSSLGLKDIHDTELGYITRFPCVTVEFDSSSELWEEMGNPPRKRVDVTVAITYYHEEWTEKTRRKEIRKQLDKLAKVLRENWTVNDYCARFGSNIDAVSAIDIMSPREQIIAGGRVTLTCSKETSVTPV